MSEWPRITVWLTREEWWTRRWRWEWAWAGQIAQGRTFTRRGAWLAVAKQEMSIW